MKYYLGMNLVTHDSAFYLIDENARIVFGVEEEKISKVRYYPTYSHFAADYMLDRAGVDRKDIVMVGLAGSLEKYQKLFLRHEKIYGREMAQRHAAVIQKEFKFRHNLIRSLNLNQASIVEVPHHLCHALSAYSLSDFSSAAVISIDGNGENETTVIFHFDGKKMQCLAKIPRPHSMGWIWQTITVQWLRLGLKGSEGKTMGLAAYGNPRYKKEFYEGFPTRLGKLPFFKVDWKTGLFESPAMQQLYGWNIKIEEILGEFQPYECIPNEYQRDIAATLQVVTNEIMLALAKYAKKMTKEENLVICGGVAMNSVANGVVERSGIFKRIFIPPNASDNGIGLGAALYAYNNNRKTHVYKVECKLPYTSCDYDNQEIEAAFKKYSLPIIRSKDIVKDTAAELVKGSIVGWFQGKLELGARALGNRSILALPFPDEMKDKVNINVKFREYWRPFAPVIKQECYNNWFDGRISKQPYMTSSQPFKIKKGIKVGAVRHIDGSGRVQTCTKDNNSRLYELLDQVEQMTKIPILLNTSFNIKGMPIVCTPEDAVLCFLCTKIDVLVMGDYIVRKSAKEFHSVSFIKVSHGSRFLDLTLKEGFFALFVFDSHEGDRKLLDELLMTVFTKSLRPYAVVSSVKELEALAPIKEPVQVYIVHSAQEISAVNFADKIQYKVKMSYKFISKNSNECYLFNLKGSSFNMKHLFNQADWDAIIEPCGNKNDPSQNL